MYEAFCKVRKHSICFSQMFSTLLGTVVCGNPNTEPAHETDDCNTSKAVNKLLEDVKSDLVERVVGIEQENKGFKINVQSLQDNLEGSVTSLESDHRDLQQRLTQVEEKQGSAMPQISCGKTLFVTC